MNRNQKNKKSPLGAILESITQNPSVNSTNTDKMQTGRVHSGGPKRFHGGPHSNPPRHTGGRKLETNLEKRIPSLSSTHHGLNKNTKSVGRPNRSGTFQH